MQDSLRNRVFVVLTISTIAWFVYTQDFSKKRNFSNSRKIERLLLSQGAIEAPVPLKLGLASNLYYVIAIDWDNSGMIDQTEILKGKGQILGMKQGKDYLWLASKNHFPQNNPNKALIASLSIFDNDQNGTIDSMDKNYGSLSVIRVVNKMTSQVSNTLHDAGVAAININKDFINHFDSEKPLIVGTAILSNNTERAIFAVPMQLIPVK